MESRRLLAWLTLALASSSISWSAPRPSVLVPDGELPSVLAEVELSPEIGAIDVGPKGASAALASSTGEGKHARSTVRLIATGQDDREIEISGFVRDLLFSPDGEELLLVQLRPATKRRSVENYLLRLDLATLKIRRDLYLPATSRSLAHWPQRKAILVACRNEVRTFLLPDMRSGPLFRILGENLSIAVIEGSRVAVGQTDRMLVVDLSDPPDQEEMPIREAIDLPSAVLDLAFAPGGGHGLARLADDRVVSVRTRPLALDGESPPAFPVAESGPVEVEAPAVAAAPPPADVAPSPRTPESSPLEVEPPELAAAAPSEVVAPPPPAAEPASAEVEPPEIAAVKPSEVVAPPPPAAEPEPVDVEPPEVSAVKPSEVVAPPPPAAEPEPVDVEPREIAAVQPSEVVAPPPPAAEPASVEVEPPEIAAVKPSEVVAPPPPAAEPEPVKVEPPEIAAVKPSDVVASPPREPDPERERDEPREVATLQSPQIRGAIFGPGRETVVAVVFFGPDNILREATRVAPEPDGTWQVHGLTDGRYRVVLDGGGGRVLLTDPRFSVVDVEVNAPLLTVDFKIVRSM